MSAWVVAFLVTAGPAFAEKRVALVVGNDTYDNLDARSQLKKARGDAGAVARSLRELGFEVIQKYDLTRPAFNAAWQEFLDKLAPGDTAAFYFAGHGVELSGRNYLLPRDVPNVKPGRDELLKRESLSLQEFLADLREKGTRLNLVILDACRDNPFEQLAGRSVGGSRGLAVTEPPEGTFIMFSAGTGESALDRLDSSDRNPNSVYTRQLLPLLKAPGLSLTEVAEQVRVGVRQMASTVRHRQTPAYYNQVLGKVCLAGCAAAPGPVQAPVSDLDRTMAACVRDPVHPGGADIASRLPEELQRERYLYGWYEEEEAVASAAPKHRAKTEVSKDVVSIDVVNGDLRISYAWQHGYVRLRAVAPMSIATRGVRPPGAGTNTPNRLGSRFQGMWVQDNGFGCVELHFDPSGDAKGSWAIKTGDLDSEVFLRRKN